MDGVIIPVNVFKKIKKVLKDPGLGKELAKAKAIDTSQAWFWTKEWQEGERKASEDIKKGRVKEFDSVEDLIIDLHKASKVQS